MLLVSRSRCDQATVMAMSALHEDIGTRNQLASSEPFRTVTLLTVPSSLVVPARPWGCSDIPTLVGSWFDPGSRMPVGSVYGLAVTETTPVSAELFSLPFG